MMAGGQKNTKILTEKKKFTHYLLKHGVQMTPGRTSVFHTIMHAHGHFAAEEIVKVCKKNKIHVSRATIYRGLRELLEAGVIRKTAFGEKHQHFEHIYDEKPHHHARCIRCSAIIEFSDLGEDKVYRNVLKNKGFKILGHEMHFYGFCRKCQDKGT